MDEAQSKEHVKKQKLPRWAKRLLLVLSIIGPLSGAVVAIVSAIYDIEAKAKEAKTQTQAGYETLAPAVQELQNLLAKTQDALDDEDQEVDRLKGVADDDERRIVRLETIIGILVHDHHLAALPPEIEKSHGVATVSRPHKLKAERPVPKDLIHALQYQDVRVQLKCAPNDPACNIKAADMAAKR